MKGYIRFFIKIYAFVILVDAILSYFPETMKHEWRRKIKKWSDYTCDPIRKYLPSSLPVDISPVVAVFLIFVFIEVFTYLW
ncbi:MAG: YggT family protein [Bacteriovorax sp.]|nr:YggT family protein [Bacteriovorax sp.]